MSHTVTHEHSSEICKGLAAVTVNALALITSAMEHLEYWMRVTSLFIGIVVGVLTIISITKRLLK